MKSKLHRVIKSFLAPKYKSFFSSEDPDELRNYELHIIGDYGFYWRALMKCPCGCGDIIYLNLDRETYPTWSVFTQKGRPTITPSINRKKGCKSHFFLRNGKIKWVD